VAINTTFSYLNKTNISLLILFYFLLYYMLRSRNSAAGISTGYGLDDRGVGGLVFVKSRIGHAIAQAVSRWLSTAEAQVSSRVWSSGICGGQSGAGTGFL
jgi:hypothetical protein